MSKEQKHTFNKADGLVPELRFPEFVKDGDWEETTLGVVTNVVSKRNKRNKTLPIYSINNKEGFIPQDKQFEGVNSTKRGYDISLYKIIEKNTFAYNPARIDIGSIGYSGELHNVIISSLYVCFKTTKEVLDIFLLYYFDTFHFNRAVKNSVEGGIRNYLFYDNFSKINVFITTILEQQKIASCLSSLDELIAAHRDKLQALKDHKKGLMQNLFPQEGEKVPKYRFPEFEGDGEWVEYTIGEVFDSFSGGTPKSNEKKYYGGKIPFIRSAEIAKNSTNLFLTDEGLNNSSAKLIKKGDLLIALYGANSGDVAISKIDGAINQAIICLRSDYSNSFAFHNISFRKEWITSRYIQGGQGNLSGEIVKSIELLFPAKPEQQKIASCLSSLDELISAEAEKIEQLQQHKKGLMQGLFPKNTH